MNYKKIVMSLFNVSVSSKFNKNKKKNTKINSTFSYNISIIIIIKILYFIISWNGFFFILLCILNSY